MFDVGFWELVMVAVVALVVLGPERLPQAASTAGRWIRTIKRMASQAQEQVERELNLQKLRDDLKKAEALGLEQLPESLNRSVDELKQAAADVTRPYARNILPPETPTAPADIAASTGAAADSDSQLPSKRTAGSPATAPQRRITPAEPEEPADGG